MMRATFTRIKLVARVLACAREIARIKWIILVQYVLAPSFIFFWLKK